MPVVRQTLQQLLVQAVAGDLVERAERLVHQQHPRARDQRAGDRHALAHAARQLMRKGLLPALRARPAPAARCGVARRRRGACAPPTSSGSGRCRSTVRHGSSAASWKTKPISRLQPRGRRRIAETRDRPPLGSIRSAMTRSKRRLAAARGPEQGEEAAARRSSRSMSSSAVTVPRSRGEAHGDRSRALRRPRRAASRLRSGVHGQRRPRPQRRPWGGRPWSLRGSWCVITSSSLGAPAVNCFKLVVERDLLLPDRRIEGAPAIGLGVGVEGEGEQHLAAPRPRRRG